ncbi:MAG: cell division protein ZapA [Methylocystaceae bacterium]|jgi:cell division protein ZapA|nr:cell division protein ZapA [Methylocystaceae bacterium]
MAALVVSIAGRSYRIACGDGEEARLEELARYVETKIQSMHENFGEIGEQRINVMAAIAIADESFDAREKIVALEQELARARKDHEESKQKQAEEAARVFQALQDAAIRIENAASALSKHTAARDEII